MGGRGSQSGLSFSIPNGGGNFSKYSVSEQLPKTSKEAIGTKGETTFYCNGIKNGKP